MIPILLAAAAGTVCSPCTIQNVRVEIGNGISLDHASVTLDHGRITAVTPGTSAPGSGAGSVVDGTGKTLAPGFLAPATDVGLQEISEEPSTIDEGAHESLRPGFSVAWGFNPATAQIPVVREEGVTGGVLMPEGGVLSGQGVWVDFTGTLDSQPDPAKPVAVFAAVNADAKDEVGGSRGQIWMHLREAFEDARFYKANKRDYDQNKSRPLSLSPFHLQALFPVIAGEIPLAIHTHRASDILDALSFAEAEKIRIIIVGGAEAWKVAPQLAKAQVPVIIDPSEQQPENFDRLASRDDLAALLEAAHVPWAITVWGSPAFIRRMRQEAGIAVAYGASHGAAIEAITLAVAKAYGKAKDYGSIEAGKRADVVLWSGDPLELSSIAEHVWIGGVEQSLRTREHELAERYK